MDKLMKVAEYTVVECILCNLSKEVNGLIENGWQPYGHLAVWNVGGVQKACQAMVKFEVAYPVRCLRPNQLRYK